MNKDNATRYTRCFYNDIVVHEGDGYVTLLRRDDAGHVMNKVECFNMMRLRVNYLQGDELRKRTKNEIIRMIDDDLISNEYIDEAIKRAYDLITIRRYTRLYFYSSNDQILQLCRKLCSEEDLAEVTYNLVILAKVFIRQHKRLQLQ